jgi:hypothetical protein
MPARVDLVALRPEEYAAARAPRLVAVTPARFLSVDGEGEFPGPAFQAVAGSLLGLLRALRARARQVDGKDFRVPPLEALVGDRLGPGAAAAPSGAVPWKVLFRVPAFVRPAGLAAAATESERDAPGARIEELREGRCLQALHVGPPEALAAAVDRLRAAAADAHLVPRGRLHVAWLSDPGRTAADRQRLVVRLPVKTR